MRTAGTQRLPQRVRSVANCLILILTIAAVPRGHAAAQSAHSTANQRFSQLVTQAQHLVESKNYRQAAQTYEEILQIDPDSFPALNDLGVLYARLGEYPRAAAMYERALRLQPHSFPLLVNLGLAYFKAGEFRAAVRPLDEATVIRPGSFQARTLLGVSYYHIKDYARASAEFERLVARQPDNSTLQYLLAESYLWSGQDRKLLNYFQKVLLQSPNSVTVHMLLGEADDGLDRTEEAIKEFKAAAALDPRRLDVNFGLGYLYWKAHQYNRAATAFKHEIEVHGDIAKSDAYLGDIALKEGKPWQARPLVEQALHLFAGIRIAHYDLGVLDAQSRDYAHAEEELKVAIRLDPSQADAHYRLAEVYRAQGKPQLAGEQLEQVREIQQQTERKLFREISGGSH
jgi:Tfp pilus assembly protein PilF